MRVCDKFSVFWMIQEMLIEKWQKPALDLFALGNDRNTRVVRFNHSMHGRQVINVHRAYTTRYRLQKKDSQLAGADVNMKGGDYHVPFVGSSFSGSSLDIKPLIRLFTLLHADGVIP